MYSIFTYIWMMFRANVGIYSIHGAYGYIYIYTYLSLHVNNETSTSRGHPTSNAHRAGGAAAAEATCGGCGVRPGSPPCIGRREGSVDDFLWIFYGCLCVFFWMFMDFSGFLWVIFVDYDVWLFVHGLVWFFLMNFGGFFLGQLFYDGYSFDDTMGY